jgi:hypothetical protein
MTRPNPLPPATSGAGALTATATGATAGDVATATADPARPTPGLWAQTHALRAVADFLDRHGTDGLAVTVTGDRITVQIPSHADTPARRAATIAHLAAALGTVPRHTDPAGTASQTAPAGWVVADGHLAGHPLHAFTPHTPAQEPTP